MSISVNNDNSSAKDPYGQTPTDGPGQAVNENIVVTQDDPSPAVPADDGGTGFDGDSDSYAPSSEDAGSQGLAGLVSERFDQLVADIKDPTLTKDQLLADVTAFVQVANLATSLNLGPTGDANADAAVDVVGSMGSASQAISGLDSTLQQLADNYSGSTGGSDDQTAPVADDGDDGQPLDQDGAPVDGSQTGSGTPVNINVQRQQVTSSSQSSDAGQSNVVPTSNGSQVGAASGSGVGGNGFVMGVLPDYDNGSSGGAAGFAQKTGVTPSVTSGYADMKDGQFDLGAAKRWIDDAKKGGVGEVSMSISAYQTTPLNASQLQGVKDMMAYAKANNIKLDIRYGYEMNYGGGGASQGGRVNNNNDPSAFKAQWNQIADVAHAAEPPATMIWSPNIASGGTRPYQDWLPSPASSIDVYAVDYYPKAGTSTADIAASIKPVADLAAKAGKPFILGEVAVDKGGSAADKANLMQQLTSPEMRAAVPNYSGFFWFDYNKGGANMSLSQDSGIAGRTKDLWTAPAAGTGDVSSDP